MSSVEQKESSSGYPKHRGRNWSGSFGFPLPRPAVSPFVEAALLVAWKEPDVAETGSERSSEPGSRDEAGVQGPEMCGTLRFPVGMVVGGFYPVGGFWHSLQSNFYQVSGTQSPLGTLHNPVLRYALVSPVYLQEWHLEARGHEFLNGLSPLAILCEAS